MSQLKDQLKLVGLLHLKLKDHQIRRPDDSKPLLMVNSSLVMEYLARFADRMMDVATMNHANPVAAQHALAEELIDPQGWELEFVEDS